MKLKAALVLAAFAAMTSPAAAQVTTDDLKWVNQCLRDNRDAKVSKDVVQKYCVCMNNKMGDNETRSITEWEKANPRARAECDRESGWK